MPNYALLATQMQSCTKAPPKKQAERFVTSSSGVKTFTATWPVPVALVTVKLIEKSKKRRVQG